MFSNLGGRAVDINVVGIICTPPPPRERVSWSAKFKDTLYPGPTVSYSSEREADLGSWLFLDFLHNMYIVLKSALIFFTVSGSKTAPKDTNTNTKPNNFHTKPNNIHTKPNNIQQVDQASSSGNRGRRDTVIGISSVTNQHRARTRRKTRKNFNLNL